MDAAEGSRPQIPNTKSQTKDQIPTRKWTTKPSPAILKNERVDSRNQIRAFVKELPKTIGNAEDVRQLVRASGSVAANWIEADEALSKKDFLMRVKICRKEAKESRLFLRLLDAGSSQSTASARDKLAAEARELTLIFSAIISKSE